MSFVRARGWYYLWIGAFLLGLVAGQLFVPPWFGMGPGSVPTPSPVVPAEAHDDDMGENVERWQEETRKQMAEWMTNDS